MPRLLSVGLIAAFTLSATACGVNAVPDDVAAAGASTARVETVIRVSVVGMTPETFEWRTTAIVDYANDRNVDTEQSSGCRTITIGDVTYGELPADQGFPADKRWVKYGGDTIDSEVPLEPEADDQLGITASTSTIAWSAPIPAPDEYLDYLRDNSAELEPVGHEDVRGVSTTRYRATIDVPQGIRIELEAGQEATDVVGSLEGATSRREIEVWIDSEGLARRVVTTDRSPGAEEGMTGDWVTTTEFFDFGLETDIQAPPAAEVLESGEWQRITEAWMHKQLDEYSGEVDEGIEPLPGAFDPSTLPDADSEQPDSCAEVPRD